MFVARGLVPTPPGVSPWVVFALNWAIYLLDVWEAADPTPPAPGTRRP